MCGRYRRERTRAGSYVGSFVYGRSYRERPDAVPLDPIHLPLAPTVYRTARLEGVFGALRDASPDAWGRRVIERIAGRPLDEIDYLLESPQDRAGALSFGRGPAPPAPIRSYNRVVQLEELRRAALGRQVPPARRPLEQRRRRSSDAGPGAPLRHPRARKPGWSASAPSRCSW